MSLVERLLLVLALAAAPSLADAQRTAPGSLVEPFDSVFMRVRRVPLLATPEEPIGVVRHVTVSGTRLFVADDSNGNIKVFDLVSGRLITTMGRSGNGPGEIRRIAGIYVDSAGNVTTVDNSRQVLVRRDPTGRLIDETRLPGQWHGITRLEIGAERRLILTGRSGVLTREGGIPVEAAPPVIYELDSTGLGRASYRVEWPKSAWQRSFANHFSSASGSILATAGYASNVVRFKDWSTDREWTDTLRARWMKPIEWPENEQYGAGTKIEQMREWIKHQVMVHGVYLGSPRWYVALVQRHDDAGEVQWAYIVSTTDGRARIATDPVPHRLHAMRGDTAYLLGEDESGNYVLDVRRVRVRW